MVQWKKSGHSCPRCKQETEILVGTMGEGDRDGVASAERCWRCGWVAGFDQEKKAYKTKKDLSRKGAERPVASIRS